MPAQVLMLSGYNQDSHHRKVELLADESDFDIVQIQQPGSGRTPGIYPSASGTRTYEIRELPVRQLGRQGDPHRIVHWPPCFGLSKRWPHLIVCEHEQEGLLAAQVALQRDLLSPRTPLILYSWQNLLRRRSPAVRVVCGYTLHSAQHIVCASSEAVDVLRRQGFAGGASVTPLFGVDTSRFRQLFTKGQLRARWNASGVTIGYVGRLVPEKGLDTLIAAAAQLTFPFTLIFAGAGEYRECLVNQAQAANIGEKCRFLPSMPNDHVPELLNAIDILVLPSRTQAHWKEQFGRVLVEAMSCQVPVVGSNSGAIPEVVADAGIIFEEGNASMLAAVLLQLFADEDLRKEYGKRGTQRVERHYSVEAVAFQTAKCWREALAGMKQSRANEVFR